MAKIVVIVSNPYPPDTRVEKEILSLKQADHEITLLARNTEPTLEIDVKKDGYDIHRVTTPIPLKLNYFNVFTYLIKYNWKAYKYALKTGFDIIHCHDLYTLPLGVILKIRSGKPLIYDCHEHYQQLIVGEARIPEKLRGIGIVAIQAAENIMSRFADTVITVDMNLKEKLLNYNKKVEIIANYPSLERFKYAIEQNKVKKSEADKKIILYVGGINRERGISVMIQALKNIVDKKKSVKLSFVGGFRDDSKNDVDKFLKENDLTNYVSIENWIEYSEAIKRYSMADIGLIVHQPIPRFIHAVPVKFFEYMAFSKPIVISDFPEIREIVEKSNCGLLVDPTDAEQVSNSILKLLENPDLAREMGKNGQKAVIETYNWEAEGKRLAKIYEGLV